MTTSQTFNAPISVSDIAPSKAITPPNGKGANFSMEHYKNLSIKNIEGEIWRGIVGFDGYMISNYGRVKSFLLKKQKIRKPTLTKFGYLQLKLNINSMYKMKLVHQLVLGSFKENNKNHKIINHKNGIKTDNRLDNLEWVSYSENQIHAYKTSLKTPKYKRVKTIIDGVEIVFESIKLAGEYLGVNPSNISRAVMGTTKSCGGLFFYKIDK